MVFFSISLVISNVKPLVKQNIWQNIWPTQNIWLKLLIRVFALPKIYKITIFRKIEQLNTYHLDTYKYYKIRARQIKKDSRKLLRE